MSVPLEVHTKIIVEVVTNDHYYPENNENVLTVRKRILRDSKSVFKDVRDHLKECFSQHALSEITDISCDNIIAFSEDDSFGGGVFLFATEEVKRVTREVNNEKE